MIVRLISGWRAGSIATEQDIVSASDDVLDGEDRVQRTMLFEVVAARIEEWILSGKFENGARLPSEEALANRFGVSRPVVREAFARVRERGLIETISGSGTFVQHPDVDHLAEALLRHLRLATGDDQAIRNLYDARIAIEVTTARRAASRATDRDKAEMAKNRNAMESAGRDRSRWTAADLAFHMGIAVASHNPFLTVLLKPLVTAIQATISQSHRSPQAIERALQAHLEIANAIETGDADAAGDVMRRHLLESQEYFSQAFLPTRTGSNPEVQAETST